MTSLDYSSSSTTFCSSAANTLCSSTETDSSGSSGFIISLKTGTFYGYCGWHCFAGSSLIWGLDLVFLNAKWKSATINIPESIPMAPVVRHCLTFETCVLQGIGQNDPSRDLTLIPLNSPSPASCLFQV